MSEPAGQRVVAVTGGGAGIGAAIAEELGRQGWFVVTVDPLLSLDGSERLPGAADSTAARIVAAGGTARASAVDVTDADGVRGLLEDLVAGRGRLDAVINVAGISRPTGFAKGSQDDWLGVLTVHLDGYRNVLAAALPLMAAAGRGTVLGITSGSGWRAADAGAYACAKRAVAALTWELGRQAPPGVTVNAMSPIAVTRMVTAALGRAPATGAAGGSAATGGLSLGSMPQPADLGPLAAHLVDDAFGWCSGAVVFAGGTEVAIVQPPRLLESLSADAVASLPHALASVEPAWIAAEAAQAAGGGTNPRFPGIAAAPSEDLPAPSSRSCFVVADRLDVADAIAGALRARGVDTTTAAADAAEPGFAGAAAAITDAGDPDAVVVAMSDAGAVHGGAGWERTLAEHDGLVGRLLADAAWARAAADRSAATGGPLRLVTVTDAGTSGGRSRAQAVAQVARAAAAATDGGVAAFAVADESGGNDPATVGALVAHLVASPGAPALSGAELVVRRGWAGLRSHPRPTGSIVVGTTEPPAWLDHALREALGASSEDDNG